MAETTTTTPPTVTAPEPIPPVRRAPTVKEGSLHHTVRLAPSVTGVTTGTPLAPSADGWVPAVKGKIISAEAGIGGELVVAWAYAILELHQDEKLEIGAGYNISELDAGGNGKLVKASGGMLTALDETTVLFTGA